MYDVTRNSTVLENGITVISETAPHFNRTALGINVLAGGIHEPAHLAGMAHLLEHLMFRGTETHSGIELQDRIEDLGGNVNGRTQLDQTSYYCTVLNDDVPRAMQLLADLIQRPKLDVEDIELEKQIIEDESCRGCFNCSMNEALFEAAYPDQPMSRPVIGYKDTVDAITRDDLVAFHNTFYVGRNITIAVCGDISHDDVVVLVKACLAELPAGDVSALPELTYHGGDMHMGTSSEESSVWLGFDITDYSVEQKRAIGMFSHILGGHGQSLLMQELREKRGLVYHVSVEERTYARRDMVRVYLEGPSRKIAEICDVAIDTIHAAAKTLSDAEVTKTLRRHHVNELMSLDELEGRALDMMTDISEMGRICDPSDRYKAYQALTTKDLTEAGRALLSVQPSIVISAPLRYAPKLSDLRNRLGNKRSGLLGGLLKRAG